jgi:hypothetical protein
MKIAKEAIICWIIAAILIIIGTSTERYTFEILAIIMIVFGYVLNLFLKPKQEKIEVEKQCSN